MEFRDTATMPLANGHDLALQGAAILHLVRYQRMALVPITAEILIGLCFILFDGCGTLASHPIPQTRDTAAQAFGADCGFGNGAFALAFVQLLPL